MLAAKAGETRGELELSMGTRVHHPGLRSGEDTLSHGRLVSPSCLEGNRFEFLALHVRAQVKKSF